MHKIVHIARPVAGVGVYIDLLVNHIDNKKFKNFLISNQQERTFKIKNKLKKQIPYFHVNLVREINLIKDIKCFIRIISLLKKIKPDIIHCHSAKAGFLGRMAGAYLSIPTIYTPHAFSYLSGENKLKRILYLTLEKIFKFFPSKILACSKSEYYRAINDLKFKNEKLYLWNNSIENNIEFTPSKIVKNLPKKYICSIGRPSYQKNIEMLLETILLIKKDIKNIHLVLLGIGLQSPTLNKLNLYIKNNNLKKNITIVPWLEREETMSILKGCQVYVSASRYEGLPYSIIEALSLSKPCVVTNVDGNNDLIINDYNGFLVKLGDINAMAKRIISIYNNKDMIIRMSENSKKEYQKKYNIKYNIYDLEKIYMSQID